LLRSPNTSPPRRHNESVRETWVNLNRAKTRRGEMSRSEPKGWTVFTKPWRQMELGELSKHVRKLGFDGVELPVRPGFQVSPDEVEEGLPKAVVAFGADGLRIASVAADPAPAVIAACGEAGIFVIRICVEVPRGRGYLERESEVKRWLDSLLPSLEDAGVTVGIQNHYGDSIANAVGVRHLVEGYDPRLVGAVWDGAHCGLNGELPRLAADILWSHLCLVNLKNARWALTRENDFGAARWQPLFVPGPEGLCSWPEMLAELSSRNYPGDICLTAEYTEDARVNELVKTDLAWAKSVAEALADGGGQ
jgi:sugar phosphate isomerase/epimerase